MGKMSKKTISKMDMLLVKARYINDGKKFKTTTDAEKKYAKATLKALDELLIDFINDVVAESNG